MIAEQLVEKEKYKNKKGLSISSFVLGIVGVITAALYYIALPCSILAVIFGVKGIRKNDMKLAKAGLILGLVGISNVLIIYLSFISLLIVTD